MIRFFDVLFSFAGILVLFPFMLIVSIIIIIESKGGVFFKQARVGKGNIGFKLLKFRTMYVGSDKKGLITVGARDKRITKIGIFVRKFKIDEIPQLLNVLIGDMSFVGPRPEVKKYVNMYSDSQKKVLNIKPGITDYASIEFSNENEILEQADNPEQFYVENIIPEKIRLNMKYINNKSISQYFIVILKTIKKVVIH